MDRCLWYAWVAFACVSLLPLTQTPARAELSSQEITQTIDATSFLLESATRPQRDNRRQSLILALRHLNDPELRPLFEHLLTLRSDELRIHGILGLAECDEQRKLDLTHIAELSASEAQIQTIMAAMDNDLLTQEDARQLIAWEGIDPAVKEVVAAQLIADGQFDQPDLLRAGLASDNLGRRGLAALLLTQLGEADGRESLYALEAPDERALEIVRRVLLRTIMRLELELAAPWAMQLANDPELSSRDIDIALHVAMRFSVPGAVERWQELYASNPGKASRIRLALIALRTAPWTEASVFETLVSSDDDLIHRIGVVCKAVAAQGDVAGAVKDLLETRSPIVNGWLPLYIDNQATPELAKSVLSTWLAYWRGLGSRELTGEIDDIITATQLMFDKDPQWAAATLRQLIHSDDTPKPLVQGLLMGLLRVQDDLAGDVVRDLKPFNIDLADNLVLVVKVRHGAPLTDEDMDRLALLIRGGGGLPPALRLQAGWTLLKRLGRHQAVLDQTIRE